MISKIILGALIYVFAVISNANESLELTELPIPIGYDKYSWHSYLWTVNSYSSQTSRARYGNKVRLYYDILLPRKEQGKALVKELAANSYRIESESNFEIDEFRYFYMVSKVVNNHTEYIARDQLVIFTIGKKHGVKVEWFQTAG